MKTLKKSNTLKIQKVQIMRQYFKDYKAKMQKEEEEERTKNASVNFDTQLEVSKGIFLKKKGCDSSHSVTDTTFHFNFLSLE